MSMSMSTVPELAIESRPVHALRHHPRNAVIYGKDDDLDLEESIRPADDDDEWHVLALLLDGNKQRIKTNEQIGREYLVAKEIETALAKRMLAQAAARTNAALGRKHDETVPLKSTEPSGGDARDKSGATSSTLSCRLSPR